MKSGGRIVPAVVLALGLTTVGWAFGGPHGGARGHGGPGRGRPEERLLERLIFPCRAGCFDASRTCFMTAASTAESCITSACPSEISAAQTACKPGRTSACKTATDTLKTCAKSCTDTAATSVSSCRTTMTSCLATCGQS